MTIDPTPPQNEKAPETIASTAHEPVKKAPHNWKKHVTGLTAGIFAGGLALGVLGGAALGHGFNDHHGKEARHSQVQSNQKDGGNHKREGARGNRDTAPGSSNMKQNKKNSSQGRENSTPKKDIQQDLNGDRNVPDAPQNRDN